MTMKVMVSWHVMQRSLVERYCLHLFPSAPHSDTLGCFFLGQQKRRVNAHTVLAAISSLLVTPEQGISLSSRLQYQCLGENCYLLPLFSWLFSIKLQGVTSQNTPNFNFPGDSRINTHQSSFPSAAAVPCSPVNAGMYKCLNPSND